VQFFCDVVKSYIAVKKFTTHHCGRWRETKSSRNFLYFINWSCLWYFICFHWVYNNLQFPRLILKGNVHQLIRNSIVQSQCVEQKLVHIKYCKISLSVVLLLQRVNKMFSEHAKHGSFQILRQFCDDNEELKSVLLNIWQQLFSFRH